MAKQVADRGKTVAPVADDTPQLQRPSAEYVYADELARLEQACAADPKPQAGGYLRAVFWRCAWR
jgi:hypothetical protein